MFVRTSLRGALAAAVAGSVVALVASPAHAVYTPGPDDPSFTPPVAADLIGVGSDTTQIAVDHVAEGATVDGEAIAGYNASHPNARIASYAATGGNQIPMPDGTEINRPNGSGAGKALLYGAGNNPQIDFARSSSANSSAETTAGLQAFPFALDSLQMAVSDQVESNAPDTITPAQIVDIYEGDITNWSAIGGTNGTIAPKIPQAGSGTRSFFTGQLTAMNNGTPVTLAGTVAEVQEHDATPIQNDPNAIAPFSIGRANLLPAGTLQLLTGWKADRAVYNVVRGTDIGLPDIQSAFGEGGFFCSLEARPLIESGGLQQLATSANGGVCGQPTQAATSNFTLNESVITTTELTAVSTTPGEIKLTATVSGEGASPEGTVDFFQDDVPVAEDVPLTSLQAIATVEGTPGAHTYSATFTPAEGTQFLASDDTVEGTILAKYNSSITETFPAKTKGSAKGTVTVKFAGSSKKPTGMVMIKKGKATVAKKQLQGGKATITIPAKKLKKGKNTFKATWAGNDLGKASSKTFTITKQVKKRR